MRVSTIGFMWFDGTYRELQCERNFLTTGPGGWSVRVDSWNVSVEGQCVVDRVSLWTALKAFIGNYGY